MVSDYHHGVNINQLEGWLEKEKQNKNKSIFGGKSHRRWFKVHSIPGTCGDSAELALCYYKNTNSKEPNGWLFLKDISCVEEKKGGEIVITHPVREFNLTAPTRVEHTIWMAGLMGLCREAKIIRDGEVITRPDDKSGESKEDEEDEGGSGDFSGRGVEQDEYDEFRNGPKETEETRRERAKKRAERRAERRGSNKGVAKAPDHSEENREDRDRRSDQYQHGNDETANTRITRAIRNPSNSNSEDEEREERKEEEEMVDDDEDERAYNEREPEPVGYSGEVAEEGKEQEQEGEEEEEGKEEEKEEVKPKKKSGPPPGRPKRKTGKYKFGTGMNGSEEFARKAEAGNNNPPTPNLLKDNRPEYDSDEARAMGLANDGGVRMEEMTLADGDKNARRLSAGVAFKDTPAKGALSMSRGSSKGETKEEDSEDEEEKSGDDSPKIKRTAADDEEFWGVEAHNPDDSILGERSFSNGVSFRFDDDSDDEDIDLEREKEERRLAVLEAERAAEMASKVESKVADSDDDNDDESHLADEDRKLKKKKKKRKSKIGAPPSGPPPRSSKSSMGPPPTSPPPKMSIEKTGLTPDKNFVSENWDDESPSPTKAKKRPSKGEESKFAKDNIPSAIKPDKNFVDEDWD